MLTPYQQWKKLKEGGMPKKTFNQLLDAVAEFYWQNNINTVCGKLGIQRDETAEKYMRGLNMIATGLQIIPSGQVAKLIGEDVAYKELVDTRTTESRIEDLISQLMMILETEKRKTPSTEHTRNMAIMFTHIEEAYMRWRYVQGVAQNTIKK